VAGIRAQFLVADLRRRGDAALSMLAIALGVALGYAIHLINDAALADFSRP
jgi:putative ABC transport system permease protein